MQAVEQGVAEGGHRRPPGGEETDSAAAGAAAPEASLIMDDMPPELEERWQESAKERQAIAEALAARRPPRTVPNRSPLPPPALRGAPSLL